MFKITSNNDLSIQADQDEKNQDAPDEAGGTSKVSRIDGSAKTLSTITKSAKSKKSKLTKPKRSNFAKTNSSGMDFLTSKAKKNLHTPRQGFYQSFNP